MAQFVAIEKSARELEGLGPVDHRPVDCACHLMSWFFVRFEISSENEILIPLETFQKHLKSHLESCAIDENLKPFAVENFSLESLESNQKRNQINCNLLWVQ